MYNWLIIILSIFAAIFLTLLPMPGWTIWLRPAWILMVLIFWSIMLPNRVSVGTAWVVGLVVDILNGSLVGEHAFAFTATVYFATSMHMRLRMFPLMQQSISIFLFVLSYQFILYCIQGFIGQLPSSQLYWLSSLTSMLLWPWLFIILRDCQRWFKVI
jgi:rod shape-determining protein MreD